MSFIIFGIAILYFLVTLRNFRYGLFIFLAALPAYLVRFKIFGLPTTMLEVLFWTLFLVWIYRYVILNPFQDLINRCRSKFGMTMGAAVVLFLFSSIISIFVSPSHLAALGIWRAYFLEPMLFLVILLTTIKNEEDFDWAIWPLVISAFYVSLYAFAQRFLGLPIIAPWQSEMRVTSIFDYPNAVGLFVAPILPLILGLWISRMGSRPTNNTNVRAISGPADGALVKSKMFFNTRSIFLILTFILGILAIIFAKSDGALIGLAAGLAVFGLIYNRKTRLAVAVVIMAISIVILAVPGVGQKVANQFLLGDWSGYVRQTIWSETWQMLKDNPLFGAGLAGYQTIFAPYHKAQGIEIFMYPHNIFFNFWSEIGMLGLLAFGWMIAGFFRKIISNFQIPISKLFTTAALASMVVVLVHGLVDVPYFKNDLSFLFWIIFATPFILPNKNHPS